MNAVVELSDAEARRVALTAQGFGRPRTETRPNLGHVRRLVSRLGAVQIDAVNVLIRPHYLAVYSRLGPYPTELFDRLVYDRRAAFEYWGHQASYLPIELYPAMRWRMAGYAERFAEFRDRMARERPGYISAVEQEITERGPLAFSDLSDPARREKKQTRYAESSVLWWRWADGKSVLESLFNIGRIAVAARRGFERLYDLSERVIPPDVLAAPEPAPEESQRTLIRHAAQALGVATIKDLADYFRLPVATTRHRVRELVESGEVHPARVPGWKDTAYLDARAKGASACARALLSPFDSLLWERERVQRLFGFTHSFELFVPAAKRRYGYYVLPFLLDESLVARVDLKADRALRKLLVLGSFLEPGAPERKVAGELAAQLRQLATWLELESLEVAQRGDLASALRRAGA